MLNGAKTVMDVCFIDININTYINTNIRINIDININKTHIHHCFGTIEHFLARMDMKIGPVHAEYNFLSI